MSRSLLSAAGLIYLCGITVGFERIKECKAGGRAGICIPQEDCKFHSLKGDCKEPYSCCLNSKINEKKCLEYYRARNKTSFCRRSSMKNRIIGGVNARDGEFPHMVVIGKDPETPEDVEWFCGGTLVSLEYVLTAAHCVQKKYGSSYKLLAGVSRLEDGGGQERCSAEVLPHPRYYPWQSEYDIALVRAAEPFLLSERVQPACLLGQATTSLLNRAIATGFGLQHPDDSKGSDRLKKVILNIFTASNCFEFFPFIKLYGRHQQNTLCAGERSGARDTCQGDSGGPLFVPLAGPPCSYGLLGVTSTGGVCGQPDSPGVYIKLAYFLSWVEQNVWPDEVKKALADF